jgi:hypothetical protein
MNQALAKKWTRELYFYQEQKGKEYYVHDFVINNHVDKNAEYVELYTEIYAKEREQPPEEKMSLGRKARYGQRYGIQRFASAPCFFSNTDTSAERVIYAIAKNEGGTDGKSGGYNAINTYDDAAMSVGLFHWNRVWLWDLLNKYKKGSPDGFDRLFVQKGLNIEGTDNKSKKFVVDDVSYTADTDVPGEPSGLRRLKLTYLFLRAAEDRAFQEAQRDCAKDWLDIVLDKTIRDKIIKDYITSEHGIALVLDVSVYRGRNSTHIKGMVNHAIDKVLNKNIADTPANWNDAVEQDIIDALVYYRSNRIERKNDMDRRTDEINNANLSKKRNSFKQ